MDWSGTLLAVIGVGMRETALFAATGFLLLGASDLTVDLIWISRTMWRRATVYRRHARASADTLPPPTAPGRLAVFIPAWDEAAVIGTMLRHALATLGGAEFRLYVGCYPNDPATVAAARAVADPRLRLVIGPVPGPTTKGDCLNRIWEAMVEDERGEGRRFKAIVLHDAEDVVHPAELRLFDRLTERFDLVQLPVVPLLDPNARWIAGHYADEFAESHGKELVVREAIGAGLPSAGVGCAFAREALGRLAGARAGPFDGESLTEDYELGLRLRGDGGRAAFVRLPAAKGRAAVATREYFPASLEAAVAQKARWMTGIALAGWDRLGWSGGLAERWMRLRDRQSVLAALLLASGYAALVLWTILTLTQRAIGLAPEPLSPSLLVLLQINAGLLLWRMTMRFGFVTAAYGWREGMRALPRMLVANAIAMLAARRAVTCYRAARRSGATRWDKTVHAFPEQLPAE